MQDKRNLRVVALVISSNGDILNAAQCKVNTDAIIAGISSAQRDASTESGRKAIYTLSGTRVNELAPGVNVVRTVDGKTIKVVK